ncbi:MAG: hypothetical protein LBQ66_07000 [Planctomycetaceae bacterium]|jgi:DNA modification methylase|nr:hypothetical protein [Planctomycetaceae bacterium]
MSYEILCGSSIDLLKKISCAVDMTFLDPPFNQQKDYALHDDDMPEEKYWEMMKTVCQGLEPDVVIRDLSTTCNIGLSIETIYKVYKRIWGREDCNYPRGEGRWLSMNGLLNHFK